MSGTQERMQELVRRLNETAYAYYAITTRRPSRIIFPFCAF